MNFDTATMEECQDYLAECKGHKRDPHTGGWITGEFGRGNKFITLEHSVPASLGVAAESLPEGFHWARIGPHWTRVDEQVDPQNWARDGRVVAVVRNEESVEQMQFVSGPCDTELLARFRACCKAWAWVRENKP